MKNLFGNIDYLGIAVMDLDTRVDRISPNLKRNLKKAKLQVNSKSGAVEICIGKDVIGLVMNFPVARLCIADLINRFTLSNFKVISIDDVRCGKSVVDKCVTNLNDTLTLVSFKMTIGSEFVTRLESINWMIKLYISQDNDIHAAIRQKYYHMYPSLCRKISSVIIKEYFDVNCDESSFYDALAFDISNYLDRKYVKDSTGVIVKEDTILW